MKKAIFKRLDGTEICHRIEEDPTAYVEHCAQTNHWGKSLRWVRAKIQVPSLADPQILEDRYPDEVYTQEDVVDTRVDIITITPAVLGEPYQPIITPAVLDPETQEVITPAVLGELTQDVITPAVTQSTNMVQLRATYSVEIVDLDVDPTYLLEQCHKNRKAAYPSLGEFADAFVKLQGGDATQMNVYVAACNAVKAQYPKP